MKNQALYYIIFEDKTQFIGGNSYFDTKWTSIPNKKIKRLFYRLPSGDHLVLSKYSKYYHMVEATKDFMRVKDNIQTVLKEQPNIEYVYIMGRRNNIVTSYRITLFTKKNDRYKIGDIVTRNFDINDKKIKELNPIGWK